MCNASTAAHEPRRFASSASATENELLLKQATARCPACEDTSAIGHKHIQHSRLLRDKSLQMY